MIWMISAFLMILSGMVMYLSVSAAMNHSKSHGISAVYAAESGAVWGLLAAREGKEREHEKTVIPLGKCEAIVEFRWEGYSEKGREGAIDSVGIEKSTNLQRNVTLLITKEENGTVHVDRAGTSKWITRS